MNIDPYDLIRAIKTSNTPRAGSPRLKHQLGILIALAAALLGWLALRR